ncbi:transcriptional regulator, AbrB family [Halothece sp. PCC 7418]|uniref:AbrB/MazE/SpoVT family DNA-binding domain-containing protein n=1 Tax=Halothece sp. (strain PCC 7418) TaxID=65093 RepID=UPI0002A069FC|nr:AbrB/MazE/SpoVT family DNA-binding domain-containing protein [Halothece sp. PCC 7418]AFZ43488.1 transcriptional regulator, AbrB family [Halothece sp. PCC 7418]
MSKVTINQQGQIQIPSEIVSQLGLEPGTEVELQVVDNKLEIHKKQKLSLNNVGKELIDTMKGKATSNLTTDEIIEITRN